MRHADVIDVLASAAINQSNLHSGARKFLEAMDDLDLTEITGGVKRDEYNRIVRASSPQVCIIYSVIAPRRH